MSEFFVGIAQMLLLGHLILTVGVLVEKLLSKYLVLTSFDQFNLNRLILLCIVLLPAAIQLIPQATIFEPVIKVWSKPPSFDVVQPIFADTRITVNDRELTGSIQPLDFLNQARNIFLYLTLIGFIFSMFRLKKDYGIIRSIIKKSHLFRKNGRLQILASASVGDPFAFRTWNQVYVIIPNFLLEHPMLLKHCLRHEIQHHRQADTVWVFVLELLRAVFFINPLVSIFISRWRQNSESICDRRVIERHSMHKKQYGAALFQMAQMFHQPEQTQLTGTASMSMAPQLLKQRIVNIMREQQKKSILVRVFATLALLSLIGVSALAFNSSAADYRLSADDVRSLVSNQQHGGIPIVVDEKVMWWLNRAVGTERGRLYTRSSIRRMKKLQKMIEGKLLTAQLPLDLLAIPIAESGYQNYDNGFAAGIWSFIPDTARKYGLIVTDKMDERLDEARLTDAAVGFYADLYSKYQDWHLAMLAYIVGGRSLKVAMNKAGHQDAFRLVREGYFKNSGGRLLPRSMAAIIILRNPQLVGM